MENTFSHELVSVIKRACFARHGNAVRPTLLVLGAPEHDLLLRSVLDELALDSTLSLRSLVECEAVILQRSLLTATIVLAATELSRSSLEQISLSQKPLLDWKVVKRDACPLFWPAHSVMDFFIVHQDSLVPAPKRTIPKEGEEQ
jgi:hypothetical protein